jgi:hypothetical protein
LTPSRRIALAGVLGLAVVFVLARGPLHLATFALPVSNDDAILLLMARHVLTGEMATILWNQPYNGALDAYLLAPLVAVFSYHTAFRLYELGCAGLLVLLAFHLGRRFGGEPAAWAAAALAACGTPYMALMTATGPPPNFLMPLLTGLPLAVILRRADADAPPGSLREVAGLGLVCGLAVWNSSLAIPAYVGIGAGLVAAGMRPRRPLDVAPAFLGGFAVGVAPLLVARAIGASGSEVVTAASAVTAIRPRWLWEKGLADLAHAVSGLVGLEVPLVVDGPERAALPAALRSCLGAALLIAVALGAWRRRALPLLGWGGALAAAFALSRRTGPDELRYVYGLVVPVLVLAGAGLGRAWVWRRAAGVGLALLIALPWAIGTRAAAAAWRDPTHAVRVWQVPPVGPALDRLRRAEVRSAYASLQFAARLALESGGGVIASQAWNERIPGDPLRFRDEVDLDPRAAWVLSPRLSRGMPRAGAFRRLLEGMGGAWQEDAADDLVVFRDFRPPYDESKPVPAAGVAVATLDGARLPPAIEDRNGATGWTAPTGLARGSGLAVRVDPPRPLSALVIQLGLEHAPLAVPWIAEVDGKTVAEGPARHGLQWVNGVPRAGKQALLAVGLGDRPAGEVRLIFQGAGPPLDVREIWLYGPGEAERPPAGEAAAREALRAARAGRWDAAVGLYSEAVRLEPERASHHAALARARWRAGMRRWLDVESLDDGGPELVLPR